MDDSLCTPTSEDADPGEGLSQSTSVATTEHGGHSGACTEQCGCPHGCTTHGVEALLPAFRLARRRRQPLQESRSYGCATPIGPAQHSHATSTDACRMPCQKPTAACLGSPCVDHNVWLHCITKHGPAGAAPQLCKATRVRRLPQGAYICPLASLRHQDANLIGGSVSGTSGVN